MNFAIVGYGNLGRALERCLMGRQDEKLTAIYSRRCEARHESGRGNPICPLRSLWKTAEKTDCLLLALSSDEDLPKLAAKFAARSCTVDAFDTHAKIGEYREEMNAAALRSGHTSLIGCGWDPGLFSVARTYAAALCQNAVTATLYGEGISQGHSAAARRVAGVIDARAYTIPREDAVFRAKAGVFVPQNERHLRRVFVLPDERSDRDEIARKISSIPHYFAGEATEVIFESEAEFSKHGKTLSHKGSVLSSFAVEGARAAAECSLDLDSNPDFTACVMIAAARAAHRLQREGKFGAFTLADLPPVYLLSPGKSAPI